MGFLRFFYGFSMGFLRFLLVRLWVGGVGSVGCFRMLGN